MQKIKTLTDNVTSLTEA